MTATEMAIIFGERANLTNNLGVGAQDISKWLTLAYHNLFNAMLEETEGNRTISDGLSAFKKWQTPVSKSNALGVFYLPKDWASTSIIMVMPAGQSCESECIATNTPGAFLDNGIMLEVITANEVPVSPWDVYNKPNINSPRAYKSAISAKQAYMISPQREWTVILEYFRMPKPIKVKSFNFELPYIGNPDFEFVATDQNCEMPPQFHDKIVRDAVDIYNKAVPNPSDVQLSLQAKQGGIE